MKIDGAGLDLNITGIGDVAMRTNGDFTTCAKLIVLVSTVVHGVTGAFASRFTESIMELSRFRAAPSARSSHVPLASDRAFPAQC